MHRWLRRLLIILTIGGGFLGLVVAIQRSSSLLEAAVFGTIYLYALYLGIRLAEGHTPIWGLYLYFGLQVPWISCKSLAYHFFSGVMVTFNFTEEGQSCTAVWGYLQQLVIAPELPLNIGVNVIALLIVFVLIVVDYIGACDVKEGLTNRSSQPLTGE